MGSKNNNTKQKQQEQLRLIRGTFVCLVTILVRGGATAIYDFLKDKSPQDIKEYAYVWDQCKNDPIGDILNRPDFELWQTVAEVRERQRVKLKIES